VTLAGIADLVRGQRSVVIEDAKTGEDITSTVLTKIIDDSN
jgi:polyhydroxyalkanoate synthesis regulator protein